MRFHRRYLIGDTRPYRAGFSPVRDDRGAEDSPAEKFGLWVWARRKALGRSRHEVARRGKINEEVLRRLELGLLPLETTVGLIPALARGLDLSVACLYRVWNDLVFADAASDAGPRQG